MVKKSVLLAMMLCALSGAVPGGQEYNDADNGNWTADNADTWGAGPGVYPAGGDTAIIDSHTVTANAAIDANIVLVDVRAGGLLHVAPVTSLTAPWQMDGGTIFINCDNGYLYGTMTVKSASTLHVESVWNYEGSRLYADVSDHASTTGALAKTAAGWLSIQGDNSNFSGGWNVQDGGLAFDSANAPGTGDILVAGARMHLGTAQTVVGSVTVQNGTYSWHGRSAKTQSGALHIDAEATFYAEVGQYNGNGLTIDGKVTGGKLKLTGATNDARWIAPLRLTNPDNSYSGGTEVLQQTGAYVEVAAAGALGGGTVKIYGSQVYTNPTAGSDTSVLGSVPAVEVRGGTLILNSTETAADLQAPIQLHQGGALQIDGGTTPVYGGAEQNVQLHSGAILDEQTVLGIFTLPVRSEIASGGQIYKGLRADFTGEESFGEDGTSLYAGLATVNSSFLISGTMNANPGAAGYSLYSQYRYGSWQSSSGIRIAGATLNVNDPADPVTLKGDGAFHLVGADAWSGSCQVLNMEADWYLKVDNAGGLPSGKTLNVNSGYLLVGDGAALPDDATVNINDGGVFYVGTTLTSGNVHMNAGGVLAGASEASLTGGNIAWDETGAQMIANNNYPTAAGPLPTNGKVNFLVGSDDWGNQTIANDIVLSDDTRLTNWSFFGYGYDPNILVASGDLTSIGSTARVAASTGKTITLNNKVNLPTQTLIIGDANTFRTVRYDQYAGNKWPWWDMPQDGVVRLTNSANDIKRIEVHAGACNVYEGDPGNVTSILGNPEEISIRPAGTLALRSWWDGTYTINTVVSGDGVVQTTDNNGNHDDWVKLAPTAERNAGLSPGNSVGTLTIDGHLAFGSVDLGALSLQNAEATFDQANWHCSGMIDANPATGWAISSGEMNDQSAAMEVAGGEPDDGAVTFRIRHDAYQDLHRLGKFRISYTTDARDGTPLDSSWTELTPETYTAALGSNMTTDGNAVIAYGPNNNQEYYTITSTLPAGVTGFRLEALNDPEGTTTYGWPTDGPGRSSNGNFVVSEFKVLAGEGGGLKYAQVVVDIVSDDGAPGVDNDLVDVTGTANLANAELAVNLPPPSGELVPGSINAVVLQAGTLSGTFSSVVRGATTDPHWDITYDDVVYAKGTVSVVLDADDWTGFGGDADLNGVVNYLDLGVLATNYDNSGMGWVDGDFTFDGQVDYMDLGILATNYDLTEGSGGAPVPEPALVILLGAGVVGLLRRRRR